MSEKDQQEPITPPQPSGRNNNNSTTKKNKGEGSINDALNSDETFFSPSSAVSAKSSSSSNNLSSPAVTQRMQFLNEAKKRREQVTTAAYENSTLLNEKYQEMSIQDDSDNPTTNNDKNDTDNSASDLDQKTNETTKKMEQVHISPPPSSKRQQQETEEKKSNHNANESFATYEDAVNNLMKEFDLSDKSSTNTPKEEQTSATKTTTTTTNDEKRGIHIITDPNHPAYVPMPPSPEAFTPHFGSSSTRSHFPSDEKPQETASYRHNSTSPTRLNTIIDDDHSSVRSDHDDPECLFYRRLNVTNDNKENNGVSSTSPFSNKMHEKNTRASPNIDNQDSNYTSPTTRDEATNDISMPDLSNLKFDIGKADSSSNNNSKLRKPTRRNQKIHSQPKDHNKQKGDDLQNDSNAESMFPPQPAPTPPFAPNVPIHPQNNTEQCPSAIPQEEESTQFRVELKQSVGKSHHGRKNKSTQKKKKPLTSKNHEANYNNQDQASSEPKLQESRVDEDVIMDVTMEDCSPTLTPVNDNIHPPNDKTTSSNNSSTKLTPPRRGWARSSDVHTDEFLAAMMTQGIKFSVGKSGKVMTTITPPRRHSAKSSDNKDSQTSETNNNSNQQTNDTQSSVDDRNVPNANEGRTEPTIDELLAKASAVINSEMGLPATGVFSNNTEQTFTTGDSKLSSSQSKATATRQSISLSSRGKSRSFTKSSSRSNGPPVPDSNTRTHDKPTSKYNISTTPKNLFSSASSAENVMSPSNHESATNSGSSVLDNMAKQLSDAKDAAKRDQIMALRDVGRSLYINAQYKESIAKYTTAINEFNQHFTSTNKEIINEELLATLYGNRAAGLMMVGAYDAASSDCTKALENFTEYRQVLSSQEIIESARSNLRPDGGITLVTKLMARKGRSCLKAGKCNSAEDAFDQAIRLGRLGLLAHKRSREAKLQSGDDSIPSEPEQIAEKSLNQTITESTINKSEVFRLKECIKAIKSLGGVNTNPDSATLKRSNLQSLHHLNTASTLAAGDMSLQEERIKCLASMRRWTEVATYCERLACDNVKSDGVYTDDLANIDPFPNIERAVYLKGNTFEADPQNTSSRLLNSREVAEAILRLPLSIAKIYMRALRLEERYSEASKASKALSDHMVRQKITGGSYDWLKVECDKFRRTINGKDRGDELYKNGEYKFAAMKYASVLTIDGEGDGSNSANLHKDPWDVITAGGRLHAVLHCNRAACLMALKLFREASKECTAALRIQSQYMKAILRRARCYARMEHFEESIAEYQRWAQLVDDAKKKANANSHFNACPFDLACDISDVEYKRAMEELIDVRTSHKKAQTAAEARSNRQKWAQDNFRRSNSDFHKRESGSNFPTHDSGTQSAYTKQRHHSFEQERSRRWDSFNGSGPKKQGQPGSDRWNKPQQPRSSFNHSNSRQSTSNGRQSLPKKVKKQNSHYSVLGIQKTATNVQVKKAYHKMALKYHPDKNKDASSTELFRQVKQAYEVLSDETNRRKYNAELRMQESMSYYS